MADATAVKKAETTLRTVPVSVREDEDVLIVKAETVALINKAFGIQDDVENESKFTRGFIFDATNSYLKAYCSRVIATWERVIDKAQKLHPAQTRDDVTKDVLASRKAQELKKFHDAAKMLQKELR